MIVFAMIPTSDKLRDADRSVGDGTGSSSPIHHLIAAAAARVRLTTILGIVVVVCGAVMLVVQLQAIHQLWTPVGLVDPWPLYDRMLRYAMGRISLDHYLLDPHVHPHAIVYTLYLIDALVGSGRQGVPHIATLISVAALVALLCLVFWRTRRHWTGRDGRLDAAPSLALLALLSGTAILLSGLSEATIVPFQSVVIVTRLIYVGLLAVLVFCQFRPNAWLHGIALAASIVGVTFYASAGVFAVLVIATHLLRIRRKGWLIASVLPLAAYVLLLHFYKPPSAEAAAIRNVLVHFRPVTLLRLAADAASYYGTPLVDGWWSPLTPGWSPSVIAITAIGGTVCATTASWSVVTLGRRWLDQFRIGDAPSPAEAVRCLMALLSLWVLVSAFSAALLWLARQQIAGPSMTTPIHFVVLTSLRYSAFAALTFVTMLFIAADLDDRRVGTALAALVFTLIAANAIHARLSTARVAAHVVDRRSLDLASTALLMGLPPTDVESSAVWPGITSDPYWLAELPRTTQFLRDRDLSYAKGVPRLGETWHDARLPLTNPVISATPSGTRICRLAASASSFAPSGFLPHRVFALMQSDSVVVGYGLRHETSVDGHILCGIAADLGPLFISTLP